MSKQTDIKVGLGRLRLSERTHDGTNWPSFLSPDDIQKILGFLVESGVVIKVDREEPFQVFLDGKKHDIKNEWLESAGYVAVEPLIKEDYFNNERFERG